MLTLTKEQERILKHIISLPKNAQNTVSIGNQMTTYPDDIDDKELIQILTYLEQINFIKIKWYGVHHDNLTCAVDITLLPEGSNYFQLQAEKYKLEHREKIKEIRAWITLTIAILAFCLSIVSLYLQFFRSSADLSFQESAPTETVTNPQKNDEDVCPTTTN